MSAISFIGLGVMCSPMAVHLANAGNTVAGFTRTVSKYLPLLKVGGTAAPSIAAATTSVDGVALILPDTPDVESVLTSPGGVFDSARPGTLLIDFSSNRPDTTIFLGSETRRAGLSYLDAPLSGGEPGAKAVTFR